MRCLSFACRPPSIPPRALPASSHRALPPSLHPGHRRAPAGLPAPRRLPPVWPRRAGAGPGRGSAAGPPAPLRARRMAPPPAGAPPARAAAARYGGSAGKGRMWGAKLPLGRAGGSWDEGTRGSPAKVERGCSPLPFARRHGGCGGRLPSAFPDHLQPQRPRGPGVLRCPPRPEHPREGLGAGDAGCGMWGEGCGVRDAAAAPALRGSGVAPCSAPGVAGWPRSRRGPEPPFPGAPCEPPPGPAARGARPGAERPRTRG